MNKDEGAYKLNRIFDQVIKKTATQFHEGWRHSTSHTTACQVDFTASMSEQDLW